jgi:hypothetical protein
MQKKKKTRNESPKFYEMDGALRAYSNRSIALAGVMGLVALIAVAGFFLVRLEPPTVIRIGSDGQASVITPYHTAKAHFLPSVLAANAAEPDELTKQGFIKIFLNRYLTYDPHTLSHNWADAMNQVTVDLRRTALADMEKNNTVGTLEGEDASSAFKLSRIEASKDDSMNYTVFGVRTVRRVTNESESIAQLVEEYHIHLKTIHQSADNPSGLLIDEYWSNQIEGEKRAAVLADDVLGTTPSGVINGALHSLTSAGGGQQP